MENTKVGTTCCAHIFSRQVLLLPGRKRVGRKDAYKAREKEQSAKYASVRKVSFKSNLKFVMVKVTVIGWHFDEMQTVLCTDQVTHFNNLPRLNCSI